MPKSTITSAQAPAMVREQLFPVNKKVISCPRYAVLWKYSKSRGNGFHIQPPEGKRKWGGSIATAQDFF